MKNEQLHALLSQVMANTYALYLKTQNYHWHVTGPHFYNLHGLFEAQYEALAEAVDSLAERLRILGCIAPATFGLLQKLSTLSEGDPHSGAAHMITALGQDHLVLAGQCKTLLEAANALNDEGTVALISERIAAHEKASWVLQSSL